MIVSYFSKEKFVQEEHEFDNHVLDISMAGKDTLSAGVRFCVMSWQRRPPEVLSKIRISVL